VTSEPGFEQDGPEPAPSPAVLWLQAGGGTPEYDRELYLNLMREHGHLLGPGDDGHGEAQRNLPCGWPHRPEPDGPVP
jgi:hypothetical protein